MFDDFMCFDNPLHRMSVCEKLFFTSTAVLLIWVYPSERLWRSERTYGLGQAERYGAYEVVYQTCVSGEPKVLRENNKAIKPIIERACCFTSGVCKAIDCNCILACDTSVKQYVRGRLHKRLYISDVVPYWV